MSDARYRSRRWRSLRLQVLRRDLWRCTVVDGCALDASVCDHIIEVYEGMPSSLFFDPSNLRAACGPHNRRRGVVARLQRELAFGADEPAPRKPMFGAIRWRKP